MPTITFEGDAPGALSLAGQTPVKEIIPQVPDTSLLLTGLQPSRGVGLLLTTFAPELLRLDTAQPSAKELFINTTTPSTFTEMFRAPGVGSLSLTSQTPTRLVRYLRSPGVGTLTTAGQDVAADTPDNRSFLPDTGVLTTATEAPLRQVGSNTLLGPSQGNINFAGLTPTLDQSRDIWITTPVGVLTVASAVPVLGTDIIMRPDVIPLTLNGQAPLFELSSVVDVSTGALTLTGLITYVAPEDLVLTLQGQAPAVTGQTKLTVDVGTITTDSYIPDVARVGFKIPANAELLLEGQAPSFSITSFISGSGEGHVISLTVQRALIPIGGAKVSQSN